MLRIPAFILLLGLSLSACQDRVEVPVTDRYPWQINLLSNGHTRIFGVELEHTRVNEAIAQLGRRYKLALFENPDGGLSLEVYYADFTRSGLSGRLVLSIDADDKELQHYKQTAMGKEKLLSGVVQYTLSEQSARQIDRLIVQSMTYLPYADLKTEIVVARFGEPAEKIRSHAKAEHWLYPDKGLDMILTEEGRDVLQYVMPARFKAFTKPLRR